MALAFGKLSLWLKITILNGWTVNQWFLWPSLFKQTVSLQELQTNDAPWLPHVFLKFGPTCSSEEKMVTVPIWLVVWTPLKNISQLGWLFPIYGKIKMFQTANQQFTWAPVRFWPGPPKDSTIRPASPVTTDRSPWIHPLVATNACQTPGLLEGTKPFMVTHGG